MSTYYHTPSSNRQSDLHDYPPGSDGQDEWGWDASSALFSGGGGNGDRRQGWRDSPGPSHSVPLHSHPSHPTLPYYEPPPTFSYAVPTQHEHDPRRGAIGDPFSGPQDSGPSQVITYYPSPPFSHPNTSSASSSRAISPQELRWSTTTPPEHPLVAPTPTSSFRHCHPLLALTPKAEASPEPSTSALPWTGTLSKLELCPPPSPTPPLPNPVVVVKLEPQDEASVASSPVSVALVRGLSREAIEIEAAEERARHKRRKSSVREHWLEEQLRRWQAAPESAGRGMRGGRIRAVKYVDE